MVPEPQETAELVLLTDGAGAAGRRTTSSQSSDEVRRKAIFLGDLVDRSPASPLVLRLVMSMVRDGTAPRVTVNHDLAETPAQFEPEPEAFKNEVQRFINGLVSHYVLDGG